MKGISKKNNMEQRYLKRDILEFDKAIYSGIKIKNHKIV